MKKVLLSTTLLFLFCFPTYAQTTEQKLGNIYEKFVQKVEKKYSSLDKQVALFEKLQKSIISYENKDLPSSTRALLHILDDINSDRLEYLYQKNLELQVTKDFSNISLNTPKYIEDLVNIYDKEIYILNEYGEYYADNDISRIIFTNFYRIESKNHAYFRKKPGIIAFYKNDFIFIEAYQKEKKIPYSEIEKHLKTFQEYFRKSDAYYAYIYTQYQTFHNEYGFYMSDLEKSGMNTDTVLVDTLEGRHIFIQDYEDVYLIKADILSDIQDKYLFLRNIINDKRDLQENTDTYFREIRALSKEITKGLTEKQKIQKIYDYILTNIRYTENFNLQQDKRIFSWVHTFKNKDGVCEGYTKLMAYMLMFSWVESPEVMRGFVIDAQDFPQIWHAWLKIGNHYYDPTFDDPIGNTQAKKIWDYKYFDLPRELFYTNRYDVWDTPENIKKLSLSERKNIVAKNLSALTKTYDADKYILLQPYVFREKYEIAPEEKITIQHLKKALKYIEVSSDFQYKYDNKKGYLNKITFYTLTENNIETILSQHEYNALNDLYLVLWSENGTSEYRIGYNLKFKK